MGQRFGPVTLLTALMAGLSAGCLYVPGFERANLYGAKRDFRDLSGKSAADPLVDGRMTRAQAVELLGPPPVASADGRLSAYTLSTRHGTWYQLLFLRATPGGQWSHALALRFGPDDVLQDHRFVTVDVPTSFESIWGAAIPAELRMGEADLDALRQIGVAEHADLLYRSGQRVPNRSSR